ncbi:MAG: restriction endonuclease subunit S [Methanobacteriaceae archaeon]|nr:restriction endonuclease subunit S [Methanobacteriaceae archaeon]
MTNKNVPKLRFSEYTDEWELYSLDDLTTAIQSGKSNKNINAMYNLYGSTGCIGKTNSIEIKGESILIARVGANAGTVQYINDICGVSDNTLIIKLKNDLNYKFLYYSLIIYNFNKIIVNSGRPLITASDLKTIRIQIPSIDEQKKIACFLYNIDKKIELLKDKKEGFVEFKHYLLQNLFPQNDEKTPKLRFTEEIYYKRQKVSDFLIESEIDVNDNINKRLTIKLNLKGIYKRETKSNEKEGATKQYKRKAGQFIYGKQNLFKGAFGIIPPELDGFLSSKDLPSFDFKDNINSKWFYYYFSRSNFYKHLENLSNGTGSKRISPEEFLKIQINVPQSIEEQEKIASFLSFVDKKIDLLYQEIEYVEEYKKGLLQKMFI